ncbi:ribosomal large subunit pseudouridine synthase D [Ligilactobacillus salitolerans]|uniref:RNA pseudouridylate synthase n=2 Tax=Ligilactobacillus salitolerans TaxID=1808352 RepID=A0A401IVE9_9LACO|nr:ribosomal large subunit pseudouridine synthase D [Ligilactobacillus salitolerans]
MLLERHFQVQNMPASLTLRQALKEWLLPRKWQHELRINRSILVNGKYLSYNNPIHNGDQIDLTLETEVKEQHYLPNPKITCQIVAENADLVIINKPGGLKTHPNRPDENGTAFNQLAAYLQTPPLMLHRLDMLTSGLLMAAKDPLVIPPLERQLAAKTMERFYMAVTEFDPKLPLSGTIQGPIGLDPSDKRKRMVRPDGLPAVTHYEIVQHNDQFALVKLSLETGRTHQLRVHLASYGMAILGDPLYSTRAASRMYLHAYKLKYCLPFNWKFNTVEIPVPPEFQALTD